MNNTTIKEEQNDKMKELYEATKEFFLKIITAVENGELQVELQAKCVCVDARLAMPKEVGKKYTIWSHGKIEKEIIVQEDTVFIVTLNENGYPVIDDQGHLNIYDMPLAKFKQKYRLDKNGHYVQDQKVMATIDVGDYAGEDGRILLPPCWNGHTETLMKGGLLMLPYNSEFTFEEHMKFWKSYLNGNAIDWYINNEPETYAPCDKNGKFKSKRLRKLFNQDGNDEVE